MYYFNLLVYYHQLWQYEQALAFVGFQTHPWAGWGSLGIVAFCCALPAFLFGRIAGWYKHHRLVLRLIQEQKDEQENQRSNSLVRAP